MVLSALCNIVYPCYHVTHKYALTWDSQLHSLVQVLLGITSADRVRRLWRQHASSSFFTLSEYPTGSCILLVSSFFLSSFFLSSGNISKSYSFDMLWPISTRFGHKNPWPMAFMSYDQNGVKGHVGVTGVKRSKTQKRYSSYRLQGMITWLMCMHQLDPRYKSYGSKNSPGVIWGHRGQKVIFTKNAIIRRCNTACP